MDASSVGSLIEMLNDIVKKYPEVKDYPIRVIEVDHDTLLTEVEEGYESTEDKPNYWMHFAHDVEVSFKGSSGYEQSGEVRFKGRE